MKVCMLVYNYWPQPVGGAETQCRRLTHALVTKGIAPIVITARSSWKDSSREMDDKVLVMRCLIFQPFIDFVSGQFKRMKSKPNTSDRNVDDDEHGEVSVLAGGTFFLEKSVRWLNALFFLTGVTWKCWRNRRDFDVLHVHSSEWLAGFAVLLGKLLTVPVLCKETSAPAFSKSGVGIPFGRFLDKQRFLGNYIVLTKIVEEQMLQLGIDKKRIFLIPNGITIPKKDTELPYNKKVVWVGNFSQGIHTKGIDILLDAWLAVQKVDSYARLILVGGGDTTAARIDAENKGIADTVEFVGFTTDVDTYYKLADVVVLPSRREGMSNVLLEAHANGIPSIASDIPANRAVILDGETGFLVPVGDASLLAAKIMQLLDNRTLLEGMGKFARKQAISRFSMDSIAAQVHECYRMVLEHP